MNININVNINININSDININIFAGLTHREPLLDEADFERFLAAVEPLMKPARDVLWVLAGRTESNVPKVRKLLATRKLHSEVFYLCYNTKQMAAYGFWKRQRGLANSKSLEPAFYVYKGKLPKKMPKNRMYVDSGSSLFNQVVKNVPVLAPKHQAYVSRALRETSLASMVGIPHDEDGAEAERLRKLLENDPEGLNQPEGAGDERDRDRAETETKALQADFGNGSSLVPARQ